jgi:hypothetical protein
VELETLLPSDHRRPSPIIVSKLSTIFFRACFSRFAEITQQPNAPFLNAGAGRNNFFAKSKDTATSSLLLRKTVSNADSSFTERSRAGSAFWFYCD